MRTDVKVGLICVFILAIGVVSYFALTANKKPQPGDTPTAQTPALLQDKPGSSVGSGLFIAPPGSATASAPAPAAGGGSFGPSSAYAGSPAPSPAPTSGPTVTLGAPGSGPTTLGAPSPTHNPGPSALEIEAPPAPATTAAGYGTDVSPRGTYTPGYGLDHTPPLTPSLGSSEYSVVKGDTFTTIAKANHTTVKAIEAANPGVSSNKLKIRQKIKLPSSTSSSSSGLGTYGTTPATRPAATRPSRSTSTAPASSLIGTSYKVKSGDSLRKIAKAAYGDEKLWRLIWRANRQQLDDPNDIAPGMSLKIPTR